MNGTLGRVPTSGKLGRWGRTLLVGAAAAATCAGYPGRASAQSIRVSGTTSARYLDVRPFRTDSVPVGDTRGDGVLRRSADGQVVRCIEGETFCRFVGSADPVAASPLIQDLEVSAWGLGRGVRAYARLRSRAVVGGGEAVWPRHDDHLDPLAAYVELDRRHVRLRAGRQWQASGLGYYNFDGASVLLRPQGGLSVELYGGRSLLRGASEPRTGGALDPVEPWAPDESEWLVGGRVRWRPDPAGALSLLYQREIRRDRLGLYAERVALDGSWRWTRWSAAATAEVDVARAVLHEARVEVEGRLRAGVGVGGFVRRYRPFFEAWTIWGAFTPVGFDEGGVRAWWRPVEHAVTLEARAARRHYPEANAATAFGTYRDTGWRLSGLASWQPVPGWRADGRLATDVGFGAAARDGSLRLERRLDARRWLGASLLAFERLYEFRVAEGTVFGLGADGGVSLGRRTTLRADVAVYRHRVEAGLPGPDWSQTRASLTARWVVGPEPGVSGGGGS